MPRLLSSTQVGKLLGADPSSVNRWIDSGRLPAHRTPGGHRRVREQDLLDFIAELGLPPPEELQPEPQAAIVLVCDADERQLQTLRRGLERSQRSLQVVTATTAIETLLQIGVFRPEVALLDVQLPGLDWPEVCRAIRSHPVTGSIRLLACAARPRPQLEAQLLEAGATALLPKPVQPAALLELLRAIR